MQQQQQQRDNIVREYATANMGLSGGDEAHEGVVNNILSNEIALDFMGGRVENIEEELSEELMKVKIEDFKKNVKEWMALDKQINRLSAAMKERRVKKNDLNEKILEFMTKYNVEDVNTEEGIIRYKKTYVKKNLTQRALKEKLEDTFKNDEAVLVKIADIFTNREQIEKENITKISSHN